MKSTNLSARSKHPQFAESHSHKGYFKMISGIVRMIHLGKMKKIFDMTIFKKYYEVAFNHSRALMLASWKKVYYGALTAQRAGPPRTEKAKHPQPILLVGNRLRMSPGRLWNFCILTFVSLDSAWILHPDKFNNADFPEPFVVLGRRKEF